MSHDATIITPVTGREKTTLLRSFDDICGVGQTGQTVTLYGNNYGDIRAVVKLRPGEWVEAVAWAPRVIDAPSS